MILQQTASQPYFTGSSPTTSTTPHKGTSSASPQQHQQFVNSIQKNEVMRAKTLSPYELNSSTMPSGTWTSIDPPPPPQMVTNDLNSQKLASIAFETGHNIKATTPAGHHHQFNNSHHRQHHHHPGLDDGYISQDYHSGSHCHSNSSHSNTSHGSVHNDSSQDHSLAFMNNSINRTNDRSESLNSSNVSRVSSHHHVSDAINTPSPSDSGVGELESILREKDAIIQHLRDTMEKNETAILQVCAEKERLWEMELRDINLEWERRWRHHQQKAFKMEQALLLQLFKLQQERKSLRLDIEKSKTDRDSMEQKFNDCYDDLKKTKIKLDEINWEVCQKSGEISLLKSQLKESKDETSVKKNEILSTKTQLKTFQKTSDEKDQEILTLEAKLKLNQEELKRLTTRVSELKKDLETSKKEAFNAQQNADLKGMQLEMKTKELEKLNIDNIKLTNQVKSSLKDISDSGDTFNSTSSSNVCSSHPGTPSSSKTDTSKSFTAFASSNVDIDYSNDLEKLKAEHSVSEDAFKREREQWLEEKNKVIRYQKHLQLNYVQMYRKNKVLESEVEQLTLELEKRDICLMDREGGGKIITEEESMC